MIQYELRSGAKFPQDFWDDLLNVRFVDCKITVGQGERVVQAHRNVLSANSPYFKTFFASGEASTTFKVTSVDYESLRAVIELIYLQKVEVPDECESKMDKLATTFQLNTTKQHIDFNESLNFGEAQNSTMNGPELEDLTENDSGIDRQPLKVLNAKRRLPVNQAMAKQRRTFGLRPRRSRFNTCALYCCRFCPLLAFVSKRLRKNHEIVCKFNSDSRSFFVCDNCGKKFLFEGKLRYHMVKKHGGGD